MSETVRRAFRQVTKATVFFALGYLGAKFPQWLWLANLPLGVLSYFWIRDKSLDGERKRSQVQA